MSGVQNEDQNTAASAEAASQKPLSGSETSLYYNTSADILPGTSSAVLGQPPAVKEPSSVPGNSAYYSMSADVLSSMSSSASGISISISLSSADNQLSPTVGVVSQIEQFDEKLKEPLAKIQVKIDKLVEVERLEKLKALTAALENSSDKKLDVDELVLLSDIYADITALTDSIESINSFVEKIVKHLSQLEEVYSFDQLKQIEKVRQLGNQVKFIKSYLTRLQNLRREDLSKDVEANLEKLQIVDTLKKSLKDAIDQSKEKQKQKKLQKKIKKLAFRIIKKDKLYVNDYALLETFIGGFQGINSGSANLAIRIECNRQILKARQDMADLILNEIIGKTSNISEAKKIIFYIQSYLIDAQKLDELESELSPWFAKDGCIQKIQQDFKLSLNYEHTQYLSQEALTKLQTDYKAQCYAILDEDLTKIYNLENLVDVESACKELCKKSRDEAALYDPIEESIVEEMQQNRANAVADVRASFAKKTTKSPVSSPIKLGSMPPTLELKTSSNSKTPSSPGDLSRRSSECPDPATSESMLKLKLDLNTCDNKQRNLLELALKRKDPALLRLLLRHGIRLEGKVFNDPHKRWELLELVLQPFHEYEIQNEYYLEHAKYVGQVLAFAQSTPLSADDVKEEVTAGLVTKKLHFYERSNEEREITLDDLLAVAQQSLEIEHVAHKEAQERFASFYKNHKDQITILDRELAEEKYHHDLKLKVVEIKLRLKKLADLLPDVVRRAHELPSPATNANRNVDMMQGSLVEVVAEKVKLLKKKQEYLQAVKEAKEFIDRIEQPKKEAIDRLKSHVFKLAEEKSLTDSEYQIVELFISGTLPLSKDEALAKEKFLCGQLVQESLKEFIGYLKNIFKGTNNQLVFYSSELDDGKKLKEPKLLDVQGALKILAHIFEKFYINEETEAQAQQPKNKVFVQKKQHKHSEKFSDEVFDVSDFIESLFSKFKDNLKSKFSITNDETQRTISHDLHGWISSFLRRISKRLGQCQKNDYEVTFFLQEIFTEELAFVERHLTALKRELLEIEFQHNKKIKKNAHLSSGHLKEIPKKPNAKLLPICHDNGLVIQQSILDADAKDVNANLLEVAVESGNASVICLLLKYDKGKKLNLQLESLLDEKKCLDQKHFQGMTEKARDAKRDLQETQKRYEKIRKTFEPVLRYLYSEMECITTTEHDKKVLRDKVGVVLKEMEEYAAGNKSFDEMKDGLLEDKVINKKRKWAVFEKTATHEAIKDVKLEDSPIGKQPEVVEGNKTVDDFIRLAKEADQAICTKRVYLERIRRCHDLLLPIERYLKTKSAEYDEGSKERELIKKKLEAVIKTGQDIVNGKTFNEEELRIALRKKCNPCVFWKPPRSLELFEEGLARASKRPRLN